MANILQLSTIKTPQTTLLPSTMAPTTTTTTTATKTRSFHHRILTLDAAVSKSIHTVFHSSIPRSLLLLLEYSADFRFSFPLALSLYFTPLRLRRPPYLISFLVGLLIDLLFIGLVKSIFRRSRPRYHPAMKPAVSVDHFSFPSGHASRVFFVAAFVSLFDDFSGNCWLVFGVWTWALLTSFSRVLLGRHFVLDVFAGACLGVLEAAFVFRYLQFQLLIEEKEKSEVLGKKSGWFSCLFYRSHMVVFPFEFDPMVQLKQELLKC